MITSTLTSSADRRPYRGRVAAARVPLAFDLIRTLRAHNDGCRA